MLKAVARRMGESKATVPHFYVSSEIDMTRALELRAELNEALADAGEKVSVNDLIVRACAQALMQHPQAHRSYVDGRHVYHAHAHVGIAVALDDGLIVPVLRDADAKGVREIAAETRDLVGRARDGKLRQTEIEGGTFTVSNLGMFDVAAFSAIINPPESTILAVSSTVERAGRARRRRRPAPDHVGDALLRPPRLLGSRRRQAAADDQAAPRGADPAARMSPPPAVHSI